MRAMPQDQLRSAIDVLRKRLQQELEAQLTALTAHQDEAIEIARRAAEANAERQWTEKLDVMRTEWTTRLESEVSATRAEGERRTGAEVTRVRAEAEEAAARVRAEAEQVAAQVSARVRAEAEQTIAQATSRLRAEADQAAAQAALRVREEADQEIDVERQKALAMLDEERARAAVDLDGERARAAAALDAERKRLDGERQAERQRAEADRQAERQRFETERQQFRSERQRFEVERQQFASERDRFESERKEHEPARQRAEHVDADFRRLETELSAERRQLQQLNEDLRVANESLRRLEATLEQERQARAEDEAARERSAADAARREIEVTHARAAERDSQLAIVDRLMAALRSMDAAGSLTQILNGLVEAAGMEAPRVALFVANGAHLQGMKAVGFGGCDIGSQRVPIKGPGLLAEAIREGESVSTSDGAGAEAPAFAALPRDRSAIAVPITVGGEPVAVLYADDGVGESQPAPASWPETVQILASHGGSCLAHLTATRTAQALRFAGGTPPSDDESSAKRYARLLVSEIKLYNEAAIRAGRENRDLLHRLRSEIDRARKLYEERVPAGAGARDTFFHQELVQTLADGDAALLGEPV